MHLLNAYATNCGLKVDKPFLLEKYFPLDIGQYITIHPYSKDAKTYDYWQEVVDILLPILAPAKIQILQIGGPKEKPLRGCYFTAGQTQPGHVAYLIRHGLLHMGADSFPVHIASSYDKKIVALYSSSYSANVGPYWGDKRNHRLLEPNRNGQRPSYSLQESPKSINTIKPETIARAVCELLEFDCPFPFETVHIGNNYLNRRIEGVPDQVVDIRSLNIESLVMRMDITFDENMLSEQLKTSKCSIVTNRPINKDLLSFFRSQILEVVYLLEENHDPDFVALLQALGIKYGLVTSLSEETITSMKLEYLDFGHILRKPAPSDVLKGIDPRKLYYRTSKFTLSKGAAYPSYMAYLNGAKAADAVANLSPVALPDGSIANFDKFLDEQEYLYVLKLSD